MSSPLRPLQTSSVPRTSGAPAVDGQAFCQKALADIRARTARGEKVRVVFDLDNTLADTRARTLSIGKAYDAANGTKYFAKRGAAAMGHDGKATAQKLGLKPPHDTQFAAQWDQAFWDGKNFTQDTAMPETVKLAQAARAAGAEVLYLTGRVESLRQASLDQLKRFGVPDADSAHLVCKPDLATRTAPFKVEQLAAWQKQGMHVSWFLTEGRRDIAAVQKDRPAVPCVLLASQLGGTEAVDPKTPVLSSR